jgi:hypothetical protein
MRTINDPSEVWTKRGDQETFFLVLEKRPPTSEERREVWAIVAVSPDDGVIQDEAYAENLQEAATLVWRESDGVPLPEQYHVELEEEEK